MKPCSATGVVAVGLGPVPPIGPQPGQGIVRIPYTAIAPTLDVNGDPLKNFVGAMIQVKGPGDTEFSDAIFAPIQMLQAVITIGLDGTYQLRNVPATMGSIDLATGRTALVYGDPSPVSVQNVQCTPAASPAIGVIGPLDVLDAQPVTD